MRTSQLLWNIPAAACVAQRHAAVEPGIYRDLQGSAGIFKVIGRTSGTNISQLDQMSSDESKAEFICPSESM